MSDLSDNNNSSENDVCFYCSHINSVHFSNKQVFENNELSDTHAGCSYVNSDGSTCICPGLRSAHTHNNN